MDIIKKLDIFICEEGIVTGDVETNTSKGNIDVVGGKCKEGYRYCTKRKVCVPITNEAEESAVRKFINTKSADIAKQKKKMKSRKKKRSENRTPEQRIKDKKTKIEDQIKEAEKKLAKWEKGVTQTEKKIKALEKKGKSIRIRQNITAENRYLRDYKKNAVNMRETIKKLKMKHRK